MPRSGHTLYGGAGNDKLYGEAGNDKLRGESGADQHVGGTGDDLFEVWDHVTMNDIVFGGNADRTGTAGYDTVLSVDGKNTAHSDLLFDIDKIK